jgi:hypothetical protein
MNNKSAQAILGLIGAYILYRLLIAKNFGFDMTLPWTDTSNLMNVLSYVASVVLIYLGLRALNILSKNNI